MKFNLTDFLQLDTKELLAVNGGFNCNGSSNTTVYPNTYYPSTPGGAGSNLPSSSRAVVGSSIRLDGTIRYDYDDGSHLFVYPDGQRQFYPGSDGKSKENNGKDASSSSGGGSCSTSTSNNPNGQGPSTTSSNPGGNQHKDTKIHSGGGTCTKTGGHSPVNPNPTNPDDVTSGGGTCSGGSSSGGSTGDPVETTNGNGTNDGPNSPSDTTVDGHLICSNPNDFHCDIIAWNHAVDAGLNPRGKDGTDWDANNKTVDQIYNEHFVGLDVDFDGKQAGKMGYILYDWEGDGKYDHIEFGMISEDGLSYSFYNNQGFEYQDKYSTRTFAQDPNAGAKPDSPGSVRFIPLN